MKYYIITSAEYTNHTSATDQQVIWTLDNTKCIIEVEDDYTISNHIAEYSNSNQLNDWRYDPSTEEWRNWMTEEDYLGS